MMELMGFGFTKRGVIIYREWWKDLMERPRGASPYQWDFSTLKGNLGFTEDPEVATRNEIPIQRESLMRLVDSKIREHRTYEFWMEMSLQPEPEDSDDSLFYLRIIKAHWMERMRRLKRLVTTLG
jgi:hypothetical protein